MSNFSVLVD